MSSVPIWAASKSHSPNRWRMLLHLGLAGASGLRTSEPRLSIAAHKRMTTWEIVPFSHWSHKTIMKSGLGKKTLLEAQPGILYFARLAFHPGQTRTFTRTGPSLQHLCSVLGSSRAIWFITWRENDSSCVSKLLKKDLGSIFLSSETKYQSPHEKSVLNNWMELTTFLSSLPSIPNQSHRSNFFQIHSWCTTENLPWVLSNLNICLGGFSVVHFPRMGAKSAEPWTGGLTTSVLMPYFWDSI